MSHLSRLIAVCLTFCCVQHGWSSGPQLYFVDNNALTINRMNLDGTDFTTIIQTERAPQGLDIDLANETIYFSDQGPGQFPNTTGRLMAANLDGSNVRPYYLATRASENVGQMRVDPVAEQIRWTDFLGNRLMRGNLNGPSNPTPFFEDDNNDGPLSVDIHLANRQVYWSRDLFTQSAIERANLDGTNREYLSGASAYSIWLDEENSLIYGSDFHNHRVFTTNLQGGEFDELFFARSTRDIRRYQDRLYWTEVIRRDVDGRTQFVAQILRKEVDGTDVEVLYEMSRSVMQTDPIALFIVPEPTGGRVFGCVVMGIMIALRRRSRRS